MRGRVGTRIPARGLRGRKATGHPDRLLGERYGTLSGTRKRSAPGGTRVANDQPPAGAVGRASTGKRYAAEHQGRTRLGVSARSNARALARLNRRGGITRADSSLIRATAFSRSVANPTSPLALARRARRFKRTTRAVKTSVILCVLVERAPLHTATRGSPAGLRSPPCHRPVVELTKDPLRGQ